MKDENLFPLLDLSLRKILGLWALGLYPCQKIVVQNLPDSQILKNLEIYGPHVLKNWQSGFSSNFGTLGGFFNSTQQWKYSLGVLNHRITRELIGSYLPMNLSCKFTAWIRNFEAHLQKQLKYSKVGKSKGLGGLTTPILLLDWTNMRDSNSS